ncbi:MAG: hypothetical protein JSV77_00975 [Dehalococcoidales bacterium]|nr:MAG: hypothetical protein JSV77_00975 [Dehalococcoidales bacterium]
MANANDIAHLERIRQDARDEIKRRIEQRDKYSIQLSIALGAIVAVAFSSSDLRMVLIAAPLVSIYFTILILYSYRIHTALTDYLRKKIEPELAQRCGTPRDIELETYYHRKSKEMPGIRQGFFLVALWVASILSLVYLWLAERDIGMPVLIVATVLYVLADLYICYFYIKGRIAGTNAET